MLATFGIWLGWPDDAAAQRRKTATLGSIPDCTDVTAHHSGVLGAAGVVSAVSGATYGSPQCPGRFVVEATWNTAPGLPDSETTAYADWADTALSKESCTFALISASFHGFKPGVGKASGDWVDLGTKTTGGRWKVYAAPQGGDLSICQTGVGIKVDPTQYKKIRIAAKAGTAIGGVKKVRVGVSNVGVPK